jgi:hypothetical protein
MAKSNLGCNVLQQPDFNSVQSIRYHFQRVHSTVLFHANYYNLSSINTIYKCDVILYYIIDGMYRYQCAITRPIVGELI